MIMKKEYIEPLSELIDVVFEGTLCASKVNPGSGVDSMNEPQNFGW